MGFACSWARELGLSHVYACTTSERIGAFFERNGFRTVAQQEIPEAKWRGIRCGTSLPVRCYRRELES